VAAAPENFRGRCLRFDLLKKSVGLQGVQGLRKRLDRQPEQARRAERHHKVGEPHSKARPPVIAQFGKLPRELFLLPAHDAAQHFIVFVQLRFGKRFQPPLGRLAAAEQRFDIGPLPALGLRRFRPVGLGLFGDLLGADAFTFGDFDALA